MRLDSNTIENLQSVESIVSGPDGANRLFIITGTVPVPTQFVSAQNRDATASFCVQVGPTLTRRQFHRAIGSAFLCDFGLKDSTGTILQGGTKGHPLEGYCQAKKILLSKKS